MYLILDAAYLPEGPVDIVRRTLDAGVRLFQYRDKLGSKRSVYDAARVLAPLLRNAGGTFIVNDHADIALAVGADGVHLGQDDLPLAHARSLLGPERVIGISTHSVEEAKAAEREGADYIGFGPVFPTRTKDAGREKGPGQLGAVRRDVGLPIIAIGGIGPDNVQEVLSAGADGIAVVSALLQAPDLMNACRILQERIAHSDTEAR